MKSIRSAVTFIVGAIWRWSLLVVVVFCAYALLVGQGELRPAYVWTATSAWIALIVVLAKLHIAYRAGAESANSRVRQWRENAASWERKYRHMLDVNRTMIDDVLLAQKHGLPVQTFLHGTRREADPQDDDRTAGA